MAGKKFLGWSMALFMTLGFAVACEKEGTASSENGEIPTQSSSQSSVEQNDEPEASSSTPEESGPEVEPEIKTNDEYIRVDADGNVSPSGEYVLFGNYPQTKVTDEEILSVLNGQAGALPTSSDAGAWTSYEYRIGGGAKADYMWYVDVETEDAKYRGVYFNRYHSPYGIKQDANQDDVGYELETAYWFVYEPVKWKIVEKQDGKATLVCDMVIDGREYQDSYEEVEYEYNTWYTYNHDAPYNTWANNYEYSEIRAWLNDTFYETAFSTSQQTIVVETTVKNDIETTKGNDENLIIEDFICNDTVDKVWLLSYQEAYTYFNDGNSRAKKSTDYAQCQGAYTQTASYSLEKADWWIRSPYYWSPFASYVGWYGSCDGGKQVNETCGVVPAVVITL